jgi:hypothetical protein
MTNDVWRIVLDLTLRPYEDIISTLRADLQLVQNVTEEFTVMNERKQVDILLDELGFKLSNLGQFTPKLDPRRGLLNIGGMFLKTLFGTAKVTDLNSLQVTLEKLESHQDDVVSSMENKVTYIKRLDSVTSTNSEVIANLFNIVKDVVIKYHDRFKEITRDVMWLNVTLHGMSELYILIRQLEFSTLKLQENLDELLGALECVLLGKLPVSLVSPHTLHGMLGNVSRKLPEGYEWVFASKYANLYKYYGIIQAAVLGNTHAIKIVLNVPLKTVNREFVLYKLFTLPSPVSNTTSVQYRPNFRYFACNEIQHRYALLTQAEVDHCTGGNVAICPANTAIYSTRVVTCQSSLYFQTLDAHRLCQRQILHQPSTPTWTRHGTVWIYHVLEPLQVTFRCLVNQTWTSKTKHLAGSGLVLQA